MRVSYCSYVLQPVEFLSQKNNMAARPGALVKVQWPDGRIGFADLCPWVLMGDEPLEKQLELFKQGRLTPLFEQTIYFAARDSRARKAGKSLFEGGVQLKNNFLITDSTRVTFGELDQIKKLGFQKIKIKLGRDLERERELVKKVAESGNFLLRLDFNAATGWQLFEAFMTNLSRSHMAKIEYVEDPVPYELEAWREARKIARLALDNESSKIDWRGEERPCCDVLILKPAVQDVDKALAFAEKWKLQLTVTSYMDHPVGVLHAYTLAQELKKKHGEMILDPGCMTLRFYKMDAFAAALPTAGPFFHRPEGVGIGFETQFGALNWIPLNFKD